ncbi:MAG: tetratricopeptide repeat protein [Lachnospirales bacterium]
MLFEKYWSTKNKNILQEMEEVSIGDAHYYINASIPYIQCGDLEKATALLKLCPKPDEMLYYYLAYCSDDKYIELGEKEDFHGFTNRLFDILVLEKIIQMADAPKANYLLGNIFYDRGRYDNAAKLWEKACSLKPEFPTTYRNLALYYYNKKSDGNKAKEYLENAFNKNKSESRIFFELDQLYKIMNIDVDTRLGVMEENIQLVDKRDDLYTEYITLLNSTG